MKILHVLLPTARSTTKIWRNWACLMGFIFRTKATWTWSKIYDQKLNYSSRCTDIRSFKKMRSASWGLGWYHSFSFFIWRWYSNSLCTCTTHNQQLTPKTFPQNTIFLGRDTLSVVVRKPLSYNGLFWDDYGQCNLDESRKLYSFFGPMQSIVIRI